MRRELFVLLASSMLFATAGCPSKTQTKKDDVELSGNAKPGTDEFGLTRRELTEAIDKVEALIAECMRKQGFEYVAADYDTVRKGMLADKSLPGLSEREFHEQYGYGIATLYTGLPPQLSAGYSPGREGLAPANLEMFKSLSPQQQASYNRALFGDHPDATFAVGLETENFSRCGGCTREAIEQVFEPEQLSATYYNPLDALINEDPRMKAALVEFGKRIRAKGFEYDHPDEPEVDVRERLNALTEGGSIPVTELSPQQQSAIEELQDYERRVAIVALDLQNELFEPVEEQIERELYARPVE